MPLFDLKCPRCSNWRDDVLVKSDGALPACDLCDTVMEKLPPLVARAVFAAGRSAESKAEWSASQRARLEKRSTDYDNKGPGKAAREEQIAKLKEKGTIPKGWSA